MATIFIEYLYWHFAIALGELVHIMLNYTKGTWRRFLIVQHLRTLFAPWHRRQPSDFVAGGSGNIGTKILDFIADIYIRLLAALVRTIVILTGLISEVFVIMLFLIFLVVWLFWPLLSLYMFIKGFSLLIT